MDPSSAMDFDVSSISKAVALGGTYYTHLDEKDRTYRWPDLWVYPPEAVVPEDEPIELPERVEQVKPGVELTAVIGDPVWQADEEEAWDAVEGFTISNDVTASGDWPGWSDPDHGMITGVGYKLFPTFSPVLSEYVPREDLDHYADLEMSVHVDGEVSVEGTTEQLAFTIPELVSFASQICRLNENDVVALGDPGSPRVLLDDAAEVTCRVESIGELTNPVVRI